MGQATVVSLKTRPWQSAQLCFEVGGILETLAPNLMFGAPVSAFQFSTIYGSPLPSPSSDPSLLAKSADIWTQLRPSYLANLRAEPRKAALDMAVTARQNAYYAKYSPTARANIITAAKCYAPGTPNNNLSMLQQLQSLSNTQAIQLTTAYNNNQRGWPGYPSTANPQYPIVVLNTVSQLKSTTYTTDSSTATPTLTTTTTPSLTTTTTPNLTTTTSGRTSERELADPALQSASIGGPTNTALDLDAPPSGGAPENTVLINNASRIQASIAEGSSGETATQTGTSTATETGKETSTETGSEASTGSAYAVETENIQNYDYTYRVPFVEAQAQNIRAQISLNDQQFSLTLATQNVPNLGAVLNNELSSIDLSVYQLQIGFINTVLVPTIDGIITGIFKYPGDPVRAGEPVIRIDDNSQMLIVARLVYPGPMNVWTSSSPPGSLVTINTTLFDASPLAPPLSGKVVAVRGAGDDDLWDVVILCANPSSSGNPVFPVGYTFDYDNTTVTIT
jgi:hypothetical protein